MIFDIVREKILSLSLPDVMANKTHKPETYCGCAPILPPSPSDY
jgi:hypothetical protein